MTGFVRASDLYNVEARETVPFDWGKMQPVAASQADVRRAVAAVEQAEGGDD